MRIESLSRYRYFLQILKEEPIHLRPYAYLLILIPLLVVCFLFDWDRELLLFVALGFSCAAVGFFAAVNIRNFKPSSLKNRAHQRLVLDYLEDVVILQDNENQKISFVNAAFYSVLGYEEPSVFKMKFENFIESNFVHLFKKAKPNKLRISSFEKEEDLIQMRKQDGVKIWMELQTKSVIEDGDFTLYTFKEVTEQVALNKATKQFARDLVQRKMDGGKINSFAKMRVV